MSEKVSDGMRKLIAAVAGPRQWSDTRESWLNRAARRAGISYRSAKAVFYGEISNPRNRSVQLLEYAARERAQSLASRFQAIAQGMENTDAEFYREDIAALVYMARRLGGADIPGDD